MTGQRDGGDRAGAGGKGEAMDWSTEMAHALTRNDYKVVAYVPDEVTDRLLQLLHEERSMRMVSVTREEEGVAVLSGAFLGGLRGALAMQSSGLGNSINALTSLAIGFQIPLLMIISERGRLDEVNPVQVPLGRAMPKIFEALGIQAFWIDETAEIRRIVDGATALAYSSSLPVALVLPTTLTGGKTWR
jgi:sulfopyruvate decarboxylase alpha subunit